MIEYGRFLLIIGVSIALIGGLMMLLGRFFPQLGNLPGDLRFERGNVRIEFPLGTMILLSIIGTILLNVFIRLFRR